MPELMLKPGWPGVFRRSVATGKGGSKTFEFVPRVAVKVSKEELELLRPELGVVVFEIERDDKDRPRFVETLLARMEATDDNASRTNNG